MATLLNGKGTRCLAVFGADCDLKVHEFGRPAPGPRDVHLDVDYCGQCRSDVHTADGSWGLHRYPIAPGHEIVGRVRAVGGEAAARFAVGDLVAVGCLVQSCGACEQCSTGHENYCTQMVQTYNSEWPAGLGHDECAGQHTNGGYSTDMVVDQRFVFKVPAALAADPARVAPLLCAGVTTYAPLARHVLGKANQAVGVVGFGGLGHMAVKLARAMGCRVVVFSRTAAKRAQAEALGAELVVAGDAAAVAARFRTLDVILDTVGGAGNPAALLATLKPNCKLVVLGGDPTPFSVSGMSLLFGAVGIEGSIIGSVKETEDMLAFCAQHNVLPDIKLVSAAEAPTAYHTLQHGDAGATRFVIDMATLRNAA